MKSYIRILLLSITLFLAANTSAQSLPVSLGIKGGLNVSTYNSKDFDSRKGFNAGLTFDVNLPAGFGVFSGLEVNTKGAELEKDGVGLKMNATYMQLPVRLGYRMNLLPGVRTHFAFGPYFAYGIGGKIKGTGTIGGDVSFNYDEKIFGDKGLNEFDWGLGVEVGAIFINRIQVRLGYDMGLKNLGKDIKVGDTELDKLKNRSIYLSAGLLFF